MGEPNLKLEECKGLNDMVEMRDVTSHAVTVLQLLHFHRTEKMTMSMLIREWRQNPKLAPEWCATIDWTEHRCVVESMLTYVCCSRCAASETIRQGENSHPMTVKELSWDYL
jgi:pantothenate kinase